MTSYYNILFQGYYCTGTAFIETQIVTPPGFYSESGATEPTPCDVGTYNTQEAQSECFQCLAGYMCNELATIVMNDCPGK